MPSKAILEQKQQVVSDLSELIRNSASGVIVNYQGITVDDDTKMRKALREAGVKYMVVKNTLTGRACDECGYSEIKQHLTGMTAIAISEKDAVAPAKILKEYADQIESFKILAGYVDGEVLDEKNVLALAEIPSKDVLVGKLLGSLLSPLYKLAFVLDAAAKKEPESAEAPAEAAPAEAATAEA